MNFEEKEAKKRNIRTITTRVKLHAKPLLAEQLGKMLYQGETAEVYEMLAQALKQVGNS